MQQSPDIPDLSSGTTNPLLAPISIAAAFSSLVAWNTEGVGALGTFFCVGTGIIGTWGFWAVRIIASHSVLLLTLLQMLFSGSSSISKKTGADKRTSTWLFGNKTAASAQKKEWKARQKGN
jgi:hypothetical protein